MNIPQARLFALLSVVGSVFLLQGNARATLRPDRVHTADSKKTQAYIADGMFVGGDRAIDDVIVKDIRRAANPGFERIVIDLEGNRSGEPAAVQRPPYYQIAVNPDERRVIFTIWGHPKLGFDARKVVGAFKRSPIVESVDLMPRLEEESWTFVLGLKAGKPVEVFELSNPVRVIVDIRTDKSAR